jgi:hypothetical protein
VSSIVDANVTDVRGLATLLLSPSARLVANASMTLGPGLTIEQVVGLTQDFAAGVTVGSNQLTIITPGRHYVSAAIQWSGAAAGGFCETPRVHMEARSSLNTRDAL